MKTYKTLASILVMLMLMSTVGMATDTKKEDTSTTIPGNHVPTKVNQEISKAPAKAPPTKALLIQDILPWNKQTNQKTLKELGIPYDVINSNQLFNINLQNYRFIIYSSDQYRSYYQNIAANRNKINKYVFNGGVLVAHVADYGWIDDTWNGLNILPANVGHISHDVNENYLANNIYINDPSHPVVKGLPGNYFNSWSHSAHGIFTNVPGGTNIVMESSDGDEGDGPTYVDYKYGKGRVLATTQTFEWKEDNKAIKNEFRLALGTPEQGNLLKNPGFEESLGPMPKYWNKYTTGKPIFTYPEPGKTGKSIAISFPIKQPERMGWWYQSNVPVTQLSKYKLSGYMRLQGVVGSGALPRPGGASIRINWYNAGGGLIKIDLINKMGTTGWVKYEKIFVAPPGATKANIGGDLYDTSGKVWFDDLSLVRVP